VTEARFATALARRRLAGAPRSDSWLCALRPDGAAWLLESALPGHPLSRWTFLGADPYAVLRGWAEPGGSRVEITCTRGVRPDVPLGHHVGSGPVGDAVRRFLPPAPDSGPGDTGDDIPFIGGAVGWFGYEWVRELEHLTLRAEDDLELPDVVLLGVDRLIAVDQHSGEAWVLALGFAADAADARERAEHAAGELAQRLQTAGPAPEAPCPRAAGAAAVSSAFDEAGYGKAVEAIRDQIAAGRVYQACLAQRLEAPFEGDAFALYRVLRDINPAPFAAFLELPEVAVVGSSPERFLRVGLDGALETRPIKGTRPRAADPEEDESLRRQLLASEKDRAENLMIVDLMRNDLGRVCALGSVGVPELFRIEAFATVFQMVSVVTGRLAPGRDALDAVAACFPPGSMTGAPKIAAMGILDALEPVRRAVYAGALGYLDARGGADLSVVIRTLLIGGGRATLHAGGGVVADSHPRAEYRESLAKARALRAALAVFGRAPYPTRDEDPVRRGRPRSP
jgi:para-aminobenzoate synthetase component 1